MTIEQWVRKGNMNANDMPSPIQKQLYSYVNEHRDIFATCIVPVTFLITGYFMLYSSSKRKNGSVREPPIAPYWIPYFGHLFGFLFDPGRLVRDLKKKYPDSPFTLIMMGHKFHVYNSSEVIAHVFSRSREYLFHPIVASMMENGLAMPKSDQIKFEVPIAEYSSDQKESRAFVEANHTVFVKNLSGQSLTTTMREYSKHFAKALEEVFPDDIVDGNTSVDLHNKLERVIFFASLNTFFGKRLQADYPEIFDDFRLIERALYVGVRSNLAFVLNPRAGMARSRLLEHFDRWVDVDLGEWGDEDPVWNEKWGLRLNWEREKLHREHNFTRRGRSCSHASFLYVMNTNSGPLTTWFLANVLQSPELLSRFQSECQKNMILSEKKNIEFDLPKLKSSPFVQGVWKESLRLGSVNAVARVLAKDIELKGYLLRQGSVILIPVQLLHYNTEVFQDPERFNPDRWDLHEDSTEAAVKQKQMMAHLRPFGGGGGICSGRFVAEEEVVLAAATLVMKYDFIIQNKVELNPMALGIMSPRKGVWVKMQNKKP